LSSREYSVCTLWQTSTTDYHSLTLHSYCEFDNQLVQTLSNKVCPPMTLITTLTCIVSVSENNQVILKIQSMSQIDGTFSGCRRWVIMSNYISICHRLNIERRVRIKIKLSNYVLMRIKEITNFDILYELRFQPFFWRQFVPFKPVSTFIKWSTTIDLRYQW